ncbi:CAP domain-containing protein [Sanguibacter antarcticus]|uniref:Uncharacterized protein YkwD n=1 Tax=Sanguibacter antarcticus TaxID=372484 RepID=A0A2A9E8C2_9MICO|nr:CAP domain-containing protein [Sanguibacter antarcticus]PFG34555.1 uncharacterized protein YkwD [Sanguibacter antarcticus]
MKSTIAVATSVLVLTLLSAGSAATSAEAPALEVALERAHASSPDPARHDSQVATAAPAPVDPPPAVEAPAVPVEATLAPAPVPAPEPENVPQPVPQPVPAPEPPEAPAPAPEAPPAPVSEPVAAAATVAIASGAPNSAGTQALFSALNSSRAAAGLPALAYNDSLAAVAQSWSANMAATGAMVHNPSVSTQIPAGWRALAENIAYAGGYADLAGTIHTNWMNSPGHRKNILGSTYTDVGIGYHVDAAGTAWATQVFARY